MVVGFEQVADELASGLIKLRLPTTAAWQFVGRAGLVLTPDKVTDRLLGDAEEFSNLVLRVIASFIGSNDLASQI